MTSKKSTASYQKLNNHIYAEFSRQQPTYIVSKLKRICEDQRKCLEEIQTLKKKDLPDEDINFMDVSSELVTKHL